MALMTVTNATTLVLNDVDSYLGYPGVPGVNATGGQKKRPLPYPFSHIVLAGSGNKQLPIKLRDFRKQLPWATLTPGEEWNQLVMAGTVTLAFATETSESDTEELLVAAL